MALKDTRGQTVHDRLPEYELNMEIKCPVCGKKYLYLGAYGVGSTPTCSYRCQCRLEKEYKASKEYREIQAQLEGHGFSRSDLDMIRPGMGVDDGPLTGEQIGEVLKVHPRLPAEMVQMIAALLLDGKSFMAIRTIMHTNDRIIRDVAAWLDIPKAPGCRKKLTRDQCDTIRRLWKEDGMTIVALSRMFGVSDRLIRQELNGGDL